MVGYVVSFAAQLQPDTLGKLEILVKTEIKPPVIGSTECVSAGHIRRERPQVREAKHRIAEVLSRRQHQIREDIGVSTSRMVAALEVGDCSKRGVTWRLLL